MMFLALFTLMYAGTSNLVSSRPLADIDNAKSSFENDDVDETINMMEVPRRRISWRQCAVYKGHRSYELYLFLDGKCRHIQSVNTVHSLYGRSVYYRTISQSDMNSCRKTVPIRGTAWLAREKGSHPVYVIFNGRKHHVSSPRTMSRCRFLWSKVVVVPRWWLNLLSNGRTIRA